MDLADEKYVLLTTFRRNGDAVATPVWIVGLPDGRLGFTTELASGKVRRIRQHADVTVQPCGVRGAVRPGSPIARATAEVLEGPAAAEVRAAIRRKYRIMTAFFVVGDLARRVLRRADPTECAIRLTMVGEGSAARQ